MSEDTTFKVRPDERLTWERDGSLRYSVMGEHLVESVIIPKEDAPTPEERLARARTAWADAIEATEHVFAQMMAAAKYAPHKRPTSQV